MMGAAPRATAVLAVAVGLLAIAAPAAEPVDPAYREIVELYARGERAAALAGLARFTDSELAQVSQAVQASVVAARRAKASKPPLPLRAATMLHLDLDEASRPEAVEREQPRRCPGPQARIAARYAGLLSWSEDGRDFARRFFVALAHRSQWDACLADAERWAREGLELFPRDAELLLAAGSALEEHATLSSGGPTVATLAMSFPHPRTTRVAGVDRDAQYRQARDFLAEAVAADGGLILAKVRLGRVRWRLGERDAARAVLADAASRSADPQLVYLAHLFLGQVHEDSGRLEPAVEQYRLALSLAPTAQAAAVALAHALGRAGKAEEAREVLGRALAHAGRRPRRDPYWDYLMNNALHVQDRLAALRRESLE
jgi:tetratricopeptide (TPR) repeat protein